ncbi:hypothetical protein ACFL1H_05195 [Nanoarchaeota archaeon]
MPYAIDHMIFWEGFNSITGKTEQMNQKFMRDDSYFGLLKRGALMRHVILDIFKDKVKDETEIIKEIEYQVKLPYHDYNKIFYISTQLVYSGGDETNPESIDSYDNIKIKRGDLYNVIEKKLRFDGILSKNTKEPVLRHCEEGKEMDPLLRKYILDIYDAITLEWSQCGEKWVDY